MSMHTIKPVSPWENIDRHQLLNLLSFARSEIDGQMALERCPHEGRFALDDGRCQTCVAADECAWLLHNDGTLPWHTRSTEDLQYALRQALSFLELQVQDWHHNVQNCSCEACRWIHSARVFLDGVRR